MSRPSTTFATSAALVIAASVIPVGGRVVAWSLTFGGVARQLLPGRADAHQPARTDLDRVYAGEAARLGGMEARWDAAQIATALR